MNDEAYDALKAGRDAWWNYCREALARHSRMLNFPNTPGVSFDPLRGGAGGLVGAFNESCVTVSIGPFAGVSMMGMPLQGLDLRTYNFELADRCFGDVSGTDFGYAYFRILPPFRYNPDHPPNLVGATFDFDRMAASLSIKQTQPCYEGLGYGLRDIYSLRSLKLYLEQNPSSPHSPVIKAMIDALTEEERVWMEKLYNPSEKPYNLSND